ncbi:sigma-54-dependent Fis family transcriptional regulator [Rhodoferax sp. 4810]|uniref:Sigma-54-dependent Fis family transcriptional regulator n=1 Tax=Thiospirillum jenense TaxID=1653858 RepID=A0A839HBP2_9GAMM|nr:sigma-54 dependent transcriptional regulator [Thiospirillum jenense]MBB1075866.1 sigma-54-dependent Fis family transcriptional regulator [Rhodoferax jenense]MBB1126111.1 sigma-54-dependent Fis family transcriptional regulator [Thiospirillum jenense]
MKILIADDDPLQRELLVGFLEKQGYQVVAAADGHEALAQFQRHPIALALLDHRMPGLTGDQVLAQMKAANPLLRAMLITAYGAVETAVQVMKLGADDFIEKPVDLKQLLGKIEQLMQRHAVATDVAAVTHTVTNTAATAPQPLDLIGDSPAMRETLSLVRRLADSPWTVLIQGETGTGKEVMAQLIHQLSPVASAPFVAVNCAAIPDNLFESELFGHEKGAFTSAERQHRGCFERANGGTLFLDEVGELPAALQSKLLRALQEKHIRRVGSERDIAIDVRVIAATNRDLRALAAAGQFREDLFFRLKVLDLTVPPLRERRADIPALIQHFLTRDARRPIQLAPETLDLLVRYDYPGNVRELEHIIQRSVTLARGLVLQPHDLPEEIRHPAAAASTGDLQTQLDTLERDLLLAALEKSEWIQTRAAEQLGISERVLRYKLGKYGLRRPAG